MAIIDELGLEVKVVVNGSDATEYTPDEDAEVDDDNFKHSTKRCYRYVESIDDAHFAVHAGVTSENSTGKDWIEKSPQHAFYVKVYLDGKRMDSCMVNRHRNPSSCDGVSDFATQTIRKFRFASVTTVDDASKQRIAKDLETAKDLGLIQVVVHRVMVDRKEKMIHSSHGAPKVSEGGISLAEKALKGRAISHGTTLSAPVKGRLSRTNVKYVDSKSSPSAVFFFKYRSKDSLQQELVIPRPRSLSMEPEVDNLSSEELRRLASERLLQIRGDNKRAASIKDENDEFPRSSRPYKRVKIGGGKKAIDLTEDD